MTYRYLCYNTGKDQRNPWFTDMPSKHDFEDAVDQQIAIVNLVSGRVYCGAHTWRSIDIHEAAEPTPLCDPVVPEVGDALARKAQYVASTYADTRGPDKPKPVCTDPWHARKSNQSPCYQCGATPMQALQQPSKEDRVFMYTIIELACVGDWRIGLGTDKIRGSTTVDPGVTIENNLDAVCRHALRSTQARMLAAALIAAADELDRETAARQGHTGGGA